MSNLVVRADSKFPFTGEFRHRLEQNRVTLPGRWRQATRTRTFAVMLWPLGEEQHLVALSPPSWENLVGQLNALDLTEDERAATERILGSSVAWLDLDSAGRLALPEQLVTKAGIRDEVELVGRMHRFEMWNPDRYQQVVLENRKVAVSIGKRLKL